MTSCIPGLRHSFSIPDLVWAASVYLSLSAGGWALDPQKAITQFSHRSWGAADGIAGVSKITQTADGYLWVLAENGLFRYDGATFTRWELPAGESRVTGHPGVIFGSRDGALWCGFAEKVCRLKDGLLTVFGLEDGLPGEKVIALFESQDGAIWAGTQTGLARFFDGKWEKWGAEHGLPEGGILATAEDKHGVLWICVGTSRRNPPCLIASLQPGESRFLAAPEKIEATVQIAEAPDGRLWGAQTGRSVRPFLRDRARMQFVHPEIQVGSLSILFDRDGALWVATIGDGLRRVRDTSRLGTDDVPQFSDRVDKFTQKDGLSSDVVNRVFEDREGNIWLGTLAGLDCLRENKVVSMSVREGLPFDQNVLVEAVSDGSVWIAATPSGFAKLGKGEKQFVHRQWLDLKNAGEGGHLTVTSLFASPAGELYVGTGLGFAVVKGNTADFVNAPQANLLRDIQAMTRDGNGTMWISGRINGLLSLTGGILGLMAGVDREIGKSVNTMHTDRTGRVWLGYANGEARVFETGAAVSHRYTAADGLAVGAIRAIRSDAQNRVWIVGEGGVSRFQGRGFRTLTARNGLPEQDLSSLLIDDDGDFWLGGVTGVFHVTALELGRAMDAESGQVRGQFFDSSDGLRGFLGFRGQEQPVAAKSTDGRLWFATNAGLAVIDPHHIPLNSQPPPVQIQKIIAGRRSYTSFQQLKFPAGTKDCEIEYAGLSFVNPAKVRYKYQLEGYDEHWVDAGPRRAAYYSNLRPQSYRFRVIACNSDGVWNEVGDTLHFSIAPAYYQKAWFPLLCAVPAALFLWGLYRLRMARMTARMNQQLQGQIKERRRIAQELHDTLLQGFTGVGMKLDVAINQLPDSLQDAKDHLRKLLEQSDQYLTEARRSVWELRATSLEKTDDYAKALADAAKRILEGTGIQLAFSVSGVGRKLEVAAEDNLLHICEEAVSNAAKHARPTQVQVNLEFGDKDVQLRVRDNGCGFDPEGREANKAGHFGLVGIRERIEALGGSLFLHSGRGAGTEIVATVRTG